MQTRFLRKMLFESRPFLEPAMSCAAAPVSLYKCTGNPSFPGSPLQWEACPLFVGEPKALSFELLLENSVLFHEIVDDRLLLAVKPACQGDSKEMERLYNV